MHARVMILLAGLMFALCLPLALTTSPAAANEDIINRLSVRYEINEDGTVDMRYELDYRFASKNQHGIKFRITTREGWYGDPDNPNTDVIYEVSDVAVESPTGANTDVRERTHDYGSNGYLELTVGSRDETVGQREHTYVVSYRITGALRTFDGQPELNWDVTSKGYPEVKKADVTVVTPGPATQAACKVGSDTCDAAVDGNTATMSHGRIDSGRTLTVVVGMEPGSVRNAEPNLEEERLSHPRLDRMDNTVEVRDDGTALVTITATYAMPQDADREGYVVDWDIPVRRPFDSHTDQLFTLSEVAVTTEDGTTLPVDVEPSRSLRGPRSFQEMSVETELPAGPESHTITLSYVVDGAVIVDGENAIFRWPITHMTSSKGTIRWEMPGDISRAASGFGFRKADLEPRDLLDWEVSGSSAQLPEDESVSESTYGEVEFPAATVPGATAYFEESIDRAATQRAITLWGTGLGGLFGLPVLGFLLGRVRWNRDQRYMGVPPGVRGDSDSVALVRKAPTAPVRFEPPEVGLLSAALVWDRRFKPEHVGALLLGLAAKGAITIRENHPLAWTRHDIDESLTADERTVYSGLGRDRGTLLPEDAENLRKRVERAQQNGGDGLLGHVEPKGKVMQWLVASALGVFIPVIAWFIHLTSPAGLPDWFTGNSAIPVTVTIGGALGGYWLVTRGRASRTAEGSLIADQLHGFREYLSTAEAHQLDFEMEAGIYREYLPWAALLGVVDQWTEACRQFAAEGRIDPIDLSHIPGGTAAHLSSALAGATYSAGTSPSSGDSGSSSGFSGGGGGSGGGGTSVSSW